MTTGTNTESEDDGADVHFWPLRSEPANNWVIWAIKCSMTLVKTLVERGGGGIKAHPTESKRIL